MHENFTFKAFALAAALAASVGLLYLAVTERHEPTFAHPPSDAPAQSVTAAAVQSPPIVPRPAEPQGVRTPHIYQCRGKPGQPVTFQNMPCEPY